MEHRSRRQTFIFPAQAPAPAPDLLVAGCSRSRRRRAGARCRRGCGRSAYRRGSTRVGTPRGAPGRARPRLHLRQRLPPSPPTTHARPPGAASLCLSDTGGRREELLASSSLRRLWPPNPPQQQQASLYFPGSSSSSRDCEAMEPTSLTMGLLQKITNNFSKERVLGQGAFGIVYRGVRDDGQEIAVKMLINNMQTIDDVQFKREFQNLMMLNHPNIVRLVGYCYETQRQHFRELQGGIDFSEATHKALCFEYMPMGSLQKHLSDEFNGLDWHTRYKIIKGACEGLKYLHEGLKTPVCHLDLKPDNILLDGNMDPKLADFGLSKFYGKEQTWMTQSPITGTLGYMPPEYLFHKVVSKKFDIFSLGVVMTKIIAGPSGHDTSAEMQQKFIDQVQGNWRKRLQTTLSSLEPLEAQCQQVKRCIEIALSCMEMDRNKRPSIVVIIRELNKTEKSTYYEQEPSPLPSNSNVVQPVASAGPSNPSPPPFPTASYIGSSTPRRRPPPVTSSVMLPPPTPPPPSGGLTEFFRMFIQRKPKIKGLSRRFTYLQLADATRDFAVTRKLGQGAFGVVYKGAVMVQDKEVDVAIKTVLVSDEASRAAFKNEVEIMSPLNHRNIIRLVGSCDEKDNLLLVYELVQNRNLQARLYDHGGLVLDWRQRYNILVGIASGLEYLHNNCSKTVLHRDIKPANVMLDMDFNAKLCDFSLVTQLTRAATSRSTNNIIGTQGYMDPAYQSTGQVTKGSDVYSFGVLLLEVVCGVAPNLIGNPPKNSLIEKVRECCERNAILDAADQRLRGNFDEEIKGALLIGLHCVETRRSDRPTTRIVLSNLVNLTASHVVM